MAQAMPRYCPRCGTPTRADMRYCATCELPVEAMLSRPGDRTELAPPGGMSEPAVIPTPGPVHQAFPAPGPAREYPPSWNTTGGEPPASPGGWSEPGVAPWAATQAGPPPLSPSDPWQASSSPWGARSSFGAPPPAAHAPQPQGRGRRRAGLLVVLLLILLALGGGGYLALSLLGWHLPGLGSSQATITTKDLNLAFPYAGVDVTLLTAQQSQNFIDDPHSASDGMLRLNLQEQNHTTVTVHYDYTTGAHVLVPGKAALAPIYVKSATTIAPGETQTSVVDFALPGAGKLSTLVFQVGASNEALLRIPLAGQASLSQYQPKTATQRGSLVYFGLTWRLTSSRTSLSLPGQQATTGMQFLMLSVRIDNPLAQEAISGSPFDYLRVRAGGQTAAPISTTIPVSFAAGEKGKTGTATFLIPQNSTTCTLLLLSQDPGGSGQASTDFQL